MALELRWVKEPLPPEGEGLPCPIYVSKLQTLSGLRVRAKCRVKGGEHIKRVKRKVDPANFAAKFRLTLLRYDWPRGQRAVIDDIVVDTCPGQPSLGHRVIMNSS